MSGWRGAFYFTKRWKGDDRFMAMDEKQYASMYEIWLKQHVAERAGESKRRLANGLGHGEQRFIEAVWIPAFGHLRGLHPEYEVADFKDGTRFIDFAYLEGSLRLAIEIDGFSTHASNINRWQFSDSRMRQNHLVLDGWTVMRFSYDDVNEKPKTCIQQLQQLIGIWRMDKDQEECAIVDYLLECEVIRLALHIGKPIKPILVQQHLQISKHRTKLVLSRLVASEKLLQTGKGTQRKRVFVVNRSKLAQHFRYGR
ncbi:endonuclease domain-containing protein [Paenibacillus sp. NEAU-GSW1]|uniref:endonuclease domain-containing protein n=1 Tax=Paenibacillus sp. NEAU-GSW1 TaxID=2682486 RepID=UPI0012E18BAB|nr:DUF559 domain-containing protein [Paenibacillus sp. NEAU-GSW1]MUT65091.1 DUF559 domain-containing protein [Paenibacillus sp. NEAU-GSW1]